MAEPTAPAPRVLAAAHAHDLGEWEATAEIDRAASDWSMDLSVVALIVFGSAWFFVPLIVGGWWLHDDVPAVGWAMVVVGALMAATALFLLYVGVRSSLAVRRRGRVLLHEFADGIVVERDGGRALAATFDEIDAALFEFQNSGDDGHRPWTDWVVLLRLPDGSSAVVDGPARSRELQRRLAQRCGASPVREHLTVAEVNDLREAHRWT